MLMVKGFESRRKRGIHPARLRPRRVRRIMRSL